MNNPTDMLTAQQRQDIIRHSLQKRHKTERRLRWAGLTAITIAISFLVILISNIFLNGYTALLQSELQVEMTIPKAELVDENGDLDAARIMTFNWNGLVKKAFRKKFPDVKGMMDKRSLGDLVSDNAGYELRLQIEKNPELMEQNLFWIKTSDDVDMYMKGRLDASLPEKMRRLDDKQIGWVDQLKEVSEIRKVFNTGFFTTADSREPESAGILGAVVGSAMALMVTIILALPLAVMAAIYLEYFARPGRVTDLIEVNINNLAAVPSIVFGLLGLSVFLGFFNMPRSAPLVGGMVLALMTLPTIIIATRASIRAVPTSIRDAALGVGASRMQAALDHVLPQAAPGILTGTIIGIAQALGETAPLIMIGMVAFVVDVPTSITDPATALPVQIFIWSDSAERAFYERSSLAIMVLLVFLISMNLLAVILRRRYEKTW
ncbi:MAG: phosphate ABC transporter permease PstA [Alphaproteobacteria bacterium]|nr:phosphate ABC transporter permease PstA [Alphaproteobacteria bacterium]